MKIALVHGKMIKDGNLTGAGVSIYNLSEQFRKYHHKVTVISPDKIKDMFTKNYANIAYIPFGRLESLNPIKILRNFIEAFSLANYYYKTSRGLDKKYFDIIDNQGFWIDNQEVLTIRYLISLYLKYTKNKTLKQKLLWFLDARMRLLLAIEKRYMLLNKFKLIIVNCSRTKEYLTKEYGINPLQIQVLSNGFSSKISKDNINKFRKEIRMRHNINKETVITFAGLNGKRKNLNIYLNIIRQFSECKGFLIGIKKDEILKISKTIPNNLEVIEYSAEIQKYLSASDILIHPTIYDEDPKIVLEAMACKCCVLTTKNGGSEDTIKNRITGFILPCREKSFTNILKILLKNKSEVKKIGLMASKSVKNRSWKKIAQKRLNLYKNLNIKRK